MSEELAARCEAASEPDRKLDMQIHEAVITFPARMGGAGWPDGALVVPVFRGWVRPPRYTASIDAAMTLVPAGMVLRRYVTTRYVPHSCEVSVSWAYGGWEGSSDHSFALALCAAALKARQP